MPRLAFLTSKSFWVILCSVTAVQLAVLFWVIGPMKFTDYASYMFYEVLPRTFAVSQSQPREDGTVETYYTVPSEVRQLPTSAPGRAPSAAGMVESPLTVPETLPAPDTPDLTGPES